MCFYFRYWAASMLLLIGSGHAMGDFIVPDFRGQPLTTYQEWDVFTSPLFQPNLPDVANQNPNFTATLTQTIPGAFLTSGGNIYSVATPVNFIVNVPDYGLGDGYVTSAVLQVRTLGTALDTSSVSLNGIAAATTELLLDQPLGPFGSDQLWKFEWNNLPGNASLNTFVFSSQESSLSLSRVSIDTLAAVPEPSSLLMLVVACLPATTIARRRLS
jgi:hypothetical protein